MYKLVTRAATSDIMANLVNTAPRLETFSHDIFQGLLWW